MRATGTAVFVRHGFIQEGTLVPRNNGVGYNLDGDRQFFHVTAEDFGAGIDSALESR